MTETEQHRFAWGVIANVMPGAEFVSHEVDLAGEAMCAVKFPIEITLNPDGCRTCGDPKDVAGLTTKCRDWHEVCQCGERYDQPKAKGCRRRKHPKVEA